MGTRISPDPPAIAEHHVRLPDQAARLLGAASAHERGIRGRGIPVAVIDSGFFPHPFYLSRGYRVRYVPTPRERFPHVDEYGHGTAQLASLFAIAPGVEAFAIKCMERDPSRAIQRALELKPRVLSCAWGFNIDHPERRRLSRTYERVARLIRGAVRDGVCVVAAGGNGQRAFPACMPEVIAAGGVYYRPDGTFEPSDVSSDFESSLFPGRRVPDLCGLVGNRPHGRLLLVPVPPKARLACSPAFSFGGAAPTGGGDGWAMFSGTSAATAMISGACALILEKHPGLSPDRVKAALLSSARPVAEMRLLDVDAALANL